MAPSEQGRYRASCAKFGYASVAIVPIHFAHGILGAIHLADRRPGQFAPGMVGFVESLAPLIAEAVGRFDAEAELAKYRDHLEELVSQRTSALEAANEKLHQEVVSREVAEQALVRTAEDLKRSNLDLEQFGYVASHDLQEPLRAVAGFVRLLEYRFPEKIDPKMREYITGAADGATRMEHLILDLLAFSRVNTSGQRLTPTDLGALLKETLLNLQLTLRDTKGTVTSDPLPTLPVDATPDRPSCSRT